MNWVTHSSMGRGTQPSRDVAEVEVESIAFVVQNALGEDSAAYSFPYVARWASGDLKLIAETGSRVVACASEILTHLEDWGLTTSPA